MMSIEAVYVITISLIGTQLLFMILMINNSRYVLKKSAGKRDSFTPSVLLTVPCKGLDRGFEDNVRSFYRLDYPDYCLNFVVESDQDPAYEILLRLKSSFEGGSKAKKVDILISGIAEEGSQKNHNLLHSISASGREKEVFAFADSDARPAANWLCHLVYPLKKLKSGASSGYRWIVPARYNIATLLLCSANAKVAQFLGKSIFNQAWGGSMAIRGETFYSLGLDQLWKTCISDDLSLTYAVNKGGYKLRFCPGCLVATYEETTMNGLFEFARRQFLITRKSAPLIWIIGLVSSLYSVAGIWGALAAAIYYTPQNPRASMLFLVTSVVFISCQLLRVYIRQSIISRILSDYRDMLRKAAMFDYLSAPFGSVFMLIFIVSSAFGSNIVWRGRRYKIINAVQTRKIN
jgi:ceramide glucosyltransferase